MNRTILSALCALLLSSNLSAAVSYQTGSYRYTGWIYSTDNSTTYSYGSAAAFFHIDPQVTLPKIIKIASHAVPFETEFSQLSFSKIEISERNQDGFNGSLSFNNPYAAALDVKLDWLTQNNPFISVDFILDSTSQFILERNTNITINGTTQSLQSNVVLRNKNTDELIIQNVLTSDFLINTILPAGSYSFNTSILVATLSGVNDINSATGSSDFSVSFLTVPLPPAFLMFLSGLSLLYARVKFRSLNLYHHF